MTYKVVTNKIGGKAVLRVYANTNISVNALSIGSAEVVNGCIGSPISRSASVIACKEDLSESGAVDYFS